MLTRRSLLGLAAAAGSLTALAGCGPSSSRSSSGSLRVYWWGGDLRASLTTEVLDLYSEDHPDVSLAPEYAEWGSYWDKLATQTAGGTTPDVLQMDEAYIDSYGAEGTLLDLETVADSLDLSGMDEAILDTGRLADGTLVGAPNGFNLFATGMNPVILEQAGIAAPDDTTWTWDSYLELCQEISEWGAANDEDVLGTVSFGRGSGDLAIWARQTNDEMLFPREGEAMVTKDTIVDLLELTRSIGATGAGPGADAQIEDASANLEQGRFATNRAAFQQVPSSQILTFQDSSGSPLQLLRMPARTAGEHRMVNKASMYWSLSARSEQTEQAAALTSYLLSDPAAAEVLKIERGIPAFAEVQEAVRPLLDENELISLDFAQQMQAEVVEPPAVTPASGVSFGDEYTRLAEESLFESRSTSEIADEILEILSGMQPEG